MLPTLGAETRESWARLQCLVRLCLKKNLKRGWNVALLAALLAYSTGSPGFHSQPCTKPVPYSTPVISTLLRQRQEDQSLIASLSYMRLEFGCCKHEGDHPYKAQSTVCLLSLGPASSSPLSTQNWQQNPRNKDLTEIPSSTTHTRRYTKQSFFVPLY